MRRKRGILGKIIIGIIVLGIIGAVFGGKEDKDSLDQTEPSKIQTEEEQASTPVIEQKVETTEDVQPIQEAEAELKPEQEPVTGIRPELKEFLDSYESFMDEYCEFMKNYNASDLSQLTKYNQLLLKYADFAEKASAWDGEEMNDEELVYYTEVLGRISEKLIKTGISLQ